MNKELIQSAVNTAVQSKKILDARKTVAESRVVPLSDGELDLVQLIAKGHSAQDIAAKRNTQVGTVYTMSRSLKRKLSVDNDVQLAIVCYQMNKALEDAAECSA